MVKQFTEYIKNEKLFTKQEKVLLTISGGIDSITMLYLFIEAGFNFGIAHCNFQLRGAESEGDQQFVEDFAKEKNLTIFLKEFDTKSYAEKNKISIQMAARELRYEWFKELAQEFGYTKIATAHNLNDVVETFFINLTRGTGIKGLTGIKPKLGNIIRPLLFAKRTEIETYVKENNIPYREDSSNAETKYMRNAIRHKIIPEFEKMNPSFLNTAAHATEVLKAAEFIYKGHINEISNKIISTKNSKTYINIEQLIEQGITPPILYELISPYGFNFEHAKGIISSINIQSGKMFNSETHQLVIDRHDLIIQEILEQDNKVYYINEITEEFTKPVKLVFSWFSKSSGFKPIKKNNFGTFDADKLNFPLELRKWQKGDSFYPFGMKGKKKLSDFFTDIKLSVIDKQEVWILTSENKIIWIVGHRTDNRFRVEETTKNILQIELK